MNEQTRIPTGAKSLKVFLQEQLFLSEEIKELLFNDKNAVYTIGYDATTLNGLGKITFDQLTATGKNKYQATTLHTFNYLGQTAQPAITQAQTENIDIPIVKREVLHNSVKKDKIALTKTE